MSIKPDAQMKFITREGERKTYKMRIIIVLTGLGTESQMTTQVTINYKLITHYIHFNVGQYDLDKYQ